MMNYECRSVSGDLPWRDEFSKPCRVKPFNPLLFIRSKELKSESMKKQNNLTKMVKFHILKYCPKREEN